MDQIERIAAVLRDAEAARKAVGPVSDLVDGGLTLEQAHAVCESNIARRVAAGERIAGYKIGFTNIAVRDKMGLPDSTYGYLMESMVDESGGEMAMSEMIAPRIETEICLRLGQDLEAEAPTAEEVLSAVDAARASFEVCDARILDWKCPYPDFFADNGFSARIILGETDWVDVTGLDLLSESVVLSQDGQTLAEGRGEMALGNPLDAIAWLAAKLAGRRRSLQAGQVVMTGTLTPITAIGRGSTYRAEFSTLGNVEKTFV